MTFATGGSALGDISTRSTPASSAAFKASARDKIPICSPLEPITRSLGARIDSLMRVCWLIVYLLIFFRESLQSEKLSRSLSYHDLLVVSRGSMSILKSFCYVISIDLVFAVKIGNCTGYLDNFEVASSTNIELLGSLHKQLSYFSR